MTVKPVIVPENKGLCYFPKNEPWNAHRPVKVGIDSK